MRNRNKQSKRQLIEHHDQIWQLGEYYNSEYVRLNKPWILQIPFHTFVDRYLGGGQVA